MALIRADKKERIDILIKDEKQVYFIELKYEQAQIDFEIDGEKFKLSSHTAHDIGWYDFIKDIKRLEHCVDDTPGAVGYVVMLTNDNLYWDKSTRGVNSEAFFIHEGRTLKKDFKMKWHLKTGEGTSKGRTDPHILNNDYHIHWRPYSEISGPTKKNTFKYLLLKV